MFRYLIVALIIFGLVGFTMLIYGLKFPKIQCMVWLAAVLLGSTIIFDTYLTALPIFLYNSNAILGIKIGTIPIEDLSYVVVLVILGPALFDYFSHEEKK